MPPLLPCAEWDSVCDEILRERGLVLVMGAPDTGKTTFVRYLVSRAVQAGQCAAVVDADIGQSELGPPACVSVGVFRESVEHLGQVQPLSTAFVGSISPEWAIPEHLAATCAMASTGRALAPLVVCDTTGMAPLTWSELLKRAKLTALRPEHVVLLARKGWTSPLLRTLESLVRPRLHRPPVPEWIAIKPPPLRAQRRAWRLAKALEGAAQRSWPLDDIVLENTWLGSGEAQLPAALRQLSRAIGSVVTHAELIGRRLGVVVHGEVNLDRVRAASEELYSTSSVMVLRPSSLQGLLVGLHDAEHRLLSLGLIADLDMGNQSITIVTPVVAPSAVRLVRLGYVRCDTAGQVLGTVRARDL